MGCVHRRHKVRDPLDGRLPQLFAEAQFERALVKSGGANNSVLRVEFFLQCLFNYLHTALTFMSFDASNPPTYLPSCMCDVSPSIYPKLMETQYYGWSVAKLARQEKVGQQITSSSLAKFIGW